MTLTSEPSTLDPSELLSPASVERRRERRAASLPFVPAPATVARQRHTGRLLRGPVHRARPPGGPGRLHGRPGSPGPFLGLLHPGPRPVRGPRGRHRQRHRGHTDHRRAGRRHGHPGGPGGGALPGRAAGPGCGDHPVRLRRDVRHPLHRHRHLRLRPHRRAARDVGLRGHHGKLRPGCPDGAHHRARRRGGDARRARRPVGRRAGPGRAGAPASPDRWCCATPCPAS